MTRARAKKANEALNQMVTKIIEAKPTLEDLEGKIVNCTKPLGDGLGACLAAHFT